MSALFDYTLSLADDALVLGHRLSEWCGFAPNHEEDLALANIALDLIGQSRLLYAHAARLEGKNRSEDDFAYQRDEGEFRNLLIAELPNGDFAQTVARIFFVSAFMLPFWAALRQSADKELSAIAERSEKEVAYHMRHAGSWVVRLALGTEESRARMIKAIDALAMWLDEIFAMGEDERQLVAEGLAADRAALKPLFHKNVEKVFAEADLEMPKTAFKQSGGRTGRHTEHLGYMLAEMQVLARRHPQAVW